MPFLGKLDPGHFTGLATTQASGLSFVNNRLPEINKNQKLAIL
jgi:hypothetical protein